MSAHAIATIRAACLAAKASGIRIVRGPFFDWTGGDGKLVAVDGLGAVLLSMRGIAPSAWGALRARLDVDNAWLYRWCIGWDRDHVIAVVDDKDRELRQDEVSLAARTLARELVDR